MSQDRRETEIRREVVPDDPYSDRRERVVEREVRREVVNGEPVPPPPPYQAPSDPRMAERQMATQAAYQEALAVRFSQVIWLLTGLLVGLIGIRFVLKLLAANPSAGFAQFIYSVTDLFMAPFAGLTATPSASGVVLELPALIAMIVYALLGWLIVRLIWILFGR
ncbi:MAG TPA: YggT family protein [Anaerolineae bacterium]|nr:YggT family protein [Anaerolineae bacterium]